MAYFSMSQSSLAGGPTRGDEKLVKETLMSDVIMDSYYLFSLSMVNFSPSAQNLMFEKHLGSLLNMNIHGLLCKEIQT